MVPHSDVRDHFQLAFSVARHFLSRREEVQAIAAENNLAETAFLVERPDGDFDLRWFTPKVEVDLCGHATLAGAEVVFSRLRQEASYVRFNSLRGPPIQMRYGEPLTQD